MSDIPDKIPLSTWAQAILYLNGEPFSLKGREYLKPIYDNGYKHILLKTARQAEKSTTLAAIMVSLSCAHPHLKTIYGAPDDSKVRAFSHQKLTPFMVRSPYVKERFLKGDDTLNNVYEKKFSNGSEIYLRNGCNEGANFRAPSGEILCLDELQDLDSGAIPVAREILSHAEGIKKFIDTGTPKSLNNPIEAEWRKSSMTEWLIPCRHCGGSSITTGQFSIKGSNHYWNNIGVSNIAPYGLICARCGEKIYPLDGQWVEMNYGPRVRVKGFRIPQPITCWADMEEIYYDKLETYSLAKFMNEVLGLSYDSATVMFPREVLMSLCSDEDKGGGYLMHDAPTKEESQYPIFAGIDWGVGVEGGGKTVLVIGIAERPDRIKIIYAKKFGAEVPLPDQRRFIIQKLQRFHVNLLCADWGAAGDRNAQIAEEVGRRRIVQVQYVGSNTFIQKYEGFLKMLRISKTLSLSDLQTDILENGHFRFPCWEMFQPFAEDMMNEFIEEDNSGNLKFNHPEGTQDDTLQALVYLNLARKLYYNIPIVHLVVNAGDPAAELLGN